MADDLDGKTRDELLAELRLARAGLRRVLAGQTRAGREIDAETRQIELEAQAQHIRELNIALEASRARSAELFDRAPAALVSVDARGRIEVANLRAAELLGTEPSRLRERSLASFMTADSALRFRALLAGAKPAAPDFVEVEIVRRDGCTKRARLAIDGAPGDGLSNAFAIAALEVDAVRQATPRVGDDSIAMLDALRDHAIWVLDLDGTVHSWNQGAAQILGYSRFEMANQSARRLSTQADRDERVLERECTAAAHGHRIAIERWFVRRDGTRVWLSGSAVPLEVANETHVLYSLRDDSDRKTAAEERERVLAAERRARADAEAANRTKDEFLARVSHELRTPLSAMNLWLQLIADNGHADEASLAALERAVHAETRIVDDLLDISRGVQGKLRMRPERIDLVLAIETTIESMLPQAEAKGVTIDLHAPDELPTVGDLGRLQQAVANLLSNAIKFSTRAGRIVVVVGRRGEECLIRVRDEGHGIAPSFLAKVFEPFAQSGQTTPSGLGLGLAIVRQIVELHGGTVTAESAGLGLGATFTIRLPLRESVPAATLEPILVANDDAVRGVRALVVEDDESVRDALVAFLRKHGLHVEIASTAREAWARLQHERPDVILCDVMMPDENGISLIRRMREAELRAASEPVPAAAITARARTTDRAAALAAGFQAYLTKPVDTRELMATIAQLARRRSTN